MKTYEEMADDLFKRRDIYLKKQRKRRTIINTISMLVLCVCLISTLTVLSLQRQDQSAPVSTPNSIDALNSTNSDNSADTGSNTTEDTPIIISGYDPMFVDEVLKTNDIDYSRYNLSAYPTSISRMLAAFLEHYKNHNALFWVYAEDWGSTGVFFNIDRSGSITTREISYRYKNNNEADGIIAFNVLMTREEILSLAETYKDARDITIRLSYNINDPLLQYLSVDVYLQYINAKDTDYIPLLIHYNQAVGDETSFDGVTWDEYVASMEEIMKKIPFSNITETASGSICIDFLYREKATKPNGLYEVGEVVNGFITGREGFMLFDYDGESILYGLYGEDKKEFSAKSQIEWFNYAQPSEAIRASVKYQLDNWNPGTVGYVFDSVIVRKDMDFYTVLSKAQITELINIPDFTKENLTIQTCYWSQIIDCAILNKCMPEENWKSDLR
jgi:hypothetical protein